MPYSLAHADMEGRRTIDEIDSFEHTIRTKIICRDLPVQMLG